MRLRYSAQAHAHIAAIFEYLDERNPVAATRVVAHIRFAAERLAQFPNQTFRVARKIATIRLKFRIHPGNPG